MGKVTFVVEFEDGKEPRVNFGMDILGGKLCVVSWQDYRDDFLSDDDVEDIRHAISKGAVSSKQYDDLMRKIEALER